MVAKGGNRSIERGVQSELLGSGEDGKGTAASRRKSSAESGGVEYFHKKLEKQLEDYHTALYTLRNGERRSREQLGTVDF